VDRPDATELIEAVTEFLAGEVLPTLDDQRLRFRTLVALNALGIAYRELTSPPVPDLDPAQANDIAALKEHVAAKLRISNPSYLEKYIPRGERSQG